MKKVHILDPFAATPRIEQGSGRYPKRLLRTYRTAALFSEVWQKRKRTSLRDFAKANLADILIRRERGEEEEAQWGERLELGMDCLESCAVQLRSIEMAHLSLFWVEL